MAKHPSMSGVRIPPDEYRALGPQAERFLAGIPLHDVSRIELPGGGPDRSIDDVRRLLRAVTASPPLAVRGLFAVRRVLGALFGWDRAGRARGGGAYVDRVDDALRRRSRVAPGTPDGPFRLVYVLRYELLAEVRNRTAHAFSCMLLEPHGDGYRLYWAIYVKPVSWLTRPYMASIEPFRRWVVYPALLGRLQRAWADTGRPAGPS